jgi:hypothetical protein
VYQTEKQLKEFADKVPEEVKTKVEGKAAALKEAIPSDDTDKVRGGGAAPGQPDARGISVHAWPRGLGGACAAHAQAAPMSVQALGLPPPRLPWHPAH